MKHLLKSGSLSLFALVVSLFVLAGCAGDDGETTPEEENPCDGITCGDNAHCDDGACVCDDGFTGDADAGCEEETEDPCANVACGDNATCDSDTGECACDEGFEGDPIEGCTQIVIDPCEGITCGENAGCIEGECICNDGYEGDPDEGCTQIIIDPCEGVTCGENAHCEEGDCICDEGFEGNPNEGCLSPCDMVECGENAYCEEGVCYCEEGFEGDPLAGCTPIPTPCDGITCGENAYCEEGACICDEGFEGNPYMGCIDATPCEGVTCGDNAECVGGACFCMNGYTGDADAGCVEVTDCSQVTCADNAVCEEGLCVCEEHYENYNPATGCEMVDYCETLGIDCATELSENSHCVTELWADALYECVCDSGFEFNEESGLCELFCEDDDLEDNDRSDGLDATHIEIPYAKNDLVSSVSSEGVVDYDVFLTHLNEGDIIQIDATFTHEEGDIDIALFYAQDGDWPVAMSASTSDNEQVIHTAETEGFYFIIVENYGVDAMHEPACTSYALDVVLLTNPCQENPTLCEGEHMLCEPRLGEDPAYECVCEAGFSLNPDTGECEEFCVADIYEPNSEAGDAFAIEALPFASEEATIHEGSDDWYRFSVSESSLISVEALFEHDLGDIDINLYHADDLEDALVSSVTTTDDEFMEYYALEAGEYFVYVEFYTSDPEACNTYTLNIDAPVVENPCLDDPAPCTGENESCVFLPGEDPDYECECNLGYEWNDETELCEAWCVNDELEENDTFETAYQLDSLPFNAPDLAVMYDDGTHDEDWFTVDLEADQLVIISAFFDHSDGNINLYIYGEDNPDEYILSSTSYSDNEEIQAIVLEAGRYYLKVRLSAYSQTCTPYTLGVTAGPNPCTGHCEGPFAECELSATAPYYQCVCDAGYALNEETEECLPDPCIDVDCDTEYADGAVCLPIFDTDPASYECACEEGYMLDGEGEEAACRFYCENDDVYEDNDQAENAQSVALPLAEEGLIVSKSDDDWFSFTADIGTVIRAEALFTHTEGDVDIKLFHETAPETYLAGSTSSNDDESFAYEVPEDEGGTYLIRIYNYTSEQCTEYDLNLSLDDNPCYGACESEHMTCTVIGDYEDFECGCEMGFVFNEAGDACVEDPCLDVDCVDEFSEYSHCIPNWDPEAEFDYECVCDLGFSFDETEAVCIFNCEDDALEDNDSSAEATVITAPYENFDLVSTSVGYDDSDFDWYVISAEAGQTLDITLTFSDDVGDIDMYLFDVAAENESSVFIDSSASFSDNEHISHEIEETGDYWIKVRSYGTFICVPYAMEVTLE